MDVGTVSTCNSATALRFAVFWAVTQNLVVIRCRRLGSSRVKCQGCSETPVRKYHYVLRNNPEERKSHLLRRESLKSAQLFLFTLSNQLQPLRERERESCLPVGAPLGPPTPGHARGQRGSERWGRSRSRATSSH